MTNYENRDEGRLVVPVEETEEDLCRVMWLSVIVQMLSDALSKSAQYPYRKHREEALAWFAAEEGEASDFAIVCDLAGIDFNCARDRVSKFLSGEIESIDFRCLRGGKTTPSQSSMNRKSYFRRYHFERKQRRRTIALTTPKKNEHIYQDHQNIRIAN